LKKVHDKNLHINQMNAEKYPEPDICADEAWGKMKNMLNNVQPPTDRVAGYKSFFKNSLLYGAACLMIVAAIIFYLSVDKTQQPFQAIIYSSNNHPTKIILPDGIVAFLDMQSNISEDVEPGKQTMITLKGAAYFEGLHQKQPMLNILAGSVKVTMLHANAYVSFDSSSGISSVHVQSGNASLKAGETIINLAVGECIQYDEKTNSFKNKQNININIFAYATKVFDFTDTPLKDAAECIGKAYGVAILFEEKELNACRITTRFDNKSLKEVLDIMAYTLNFTYTLDEKNKLAILKKEGGE